MALKIRALRNVGIQCPKTPDAFNRENCDDDIRKMIDGKESIKFMVWMKVQTNDKFRWKMVEKEMRTNDFAEMFLKEVDEFRGHVERVKNQYEQMKLKRESLKNGEVFIWMDFAENFTCSAVEEVQSAYWNPQMVTLHTMVIYFPKGHVKSHKSVVAISDVLQHNATMVYSIINSLIPFMRIEYPELKTIHYLTDSPTSQYRNKTIFQLLSLHESGFNVTATWYYPEAGHGKGPCDGLGASVKRSASLAVKQNKAVIQNASDFFAWTQRQSSNESVVSYLFISQEQYDQSGEIIKGRSQDLLSVKETMRIHAVLPISEHVVYCRERSCCCADCSEDVTTTSCGGWERHYLKLGITNEDQIEQPENEVENADTVDEDQTTLAEDDYVSAIYENEWFIGQVMVIDEEEGEVHINFMQKCSKTTDTFKWPSTPDRIWIEKSKILKTISAPEPCGKSRRSFKMSNMDIEVVERLFADFIGR